MRLSDAGMRERQTKLIYPHHRPTPWPIRAAARDLSNRLLGRAAIRATSSIGTIQAAAHFHRRRIEIVNGTIRPVNGVPTHQIAAYTVAFSVRAQGDDIRRVRRNRREITKPSQTDRATFWYARKSRYGCLQTRTRAALIDCVRGYGTTRNLRQGDEANH